MEDKQKELLEEFRVVLQSITAQSQTVLDVLARHAEVLAVPTRDIPTVEELVEQAKLDDTKRKLLQNTLAELEFDNTEIEFH